MEDNISFGKMWEKEKNSASTLKSFVTSFKFENKDILNLIDELKKDNIDIVNRMESLMNFKITEKNEEEFKRLVKIVTGIFNSKNKDWIKIMQQELKKNNRIIYDEDFEKLENAIDKYNEFSKSVAGKNIAVKESRKEEIVNFSIDMFFDKYYEMHKDEIETEGAFYEMEVAEQKSRGNYVLYDEYENEQRMDSGEAR